MFRNFVSMKKAILKILAFFGIYLLIFILIKPLFLSVHHSLMGGISAGDWFSVIYHGFSMDCSVAAYFTVIPALTVFVSLFTDLRWLAIAQNVYVILTSLIISFCIILDLALYSYWGFRLDTTPFFYFSTSPASAMASASVLQIIGGILGFLILATAIFLLLLKTALAIKVKPVRGVAAPLVVLLLTASLIIPMRGSVTVSTMNLSRAYFSQNPRLNHAAINPLFSLMYSATHQDGFDTQFRYFDRSDNSRIFAQAMARHRIADSDSVTRLLSVDRPDIYIIIMESFSAGLMPSLGGEDIASGLDSIARSGLLFSNFYASGFRTDRAIPAVLGAFPSQPTTSLMKYARKIENAPSLPRKLKDNGYSLSYYYGGDANFTNMLAYLVSSGFDRVISDKDFPVVQRTSKWGAHDHIVFDRALADIRQTSAADSVPTFTVIQTSSSHEPFVVPYSDPRFADSDRKNAFAYADSSITSFVDSLAASGRWERSLVILVPDHWGVYPQNIEDPFARHHVPLIITGGALALPPSVIATPADQTAIAGTLLAALGIAYDEFTFTRDLFDSASPKFAFFSEPGMAALITPTDSVALNLDTGLTVRASGADTTATIDICKSILQTVYDKISEL